MNGKPAERTEIERPDGRRIIAKLHHNGFAWVGPGPTDRWLWTVRVEGRAMGKDAARAAAEAIVSVLSATPPHTPASASRVAPRARPQPETNASSGLPHVEG